MNETHYTNNVLKKRFLKLKCKFKKHHQGLHSKGWPDCEVRGWRKTVCMNIEVKVDDRKVTLFQRQELLDICKHGGYGFVIRRMNDKRRTEYILGMDEKSRLEALYIGMAFEKMDTSGRFVYRFDESLALQEQYKKIMEG